VPKEFGRIRTSLGCGHRLADNTDAQVESPRAGSHGTGVAKNEHPGCDTVGKAARK